MDTGSQTKIPKVALFYDWLNQWGGAEKVLLSLIKLYPDAPVYTLVYDPAKTPWLPRNTRVIPSFINRLPFSQNNPVFYTPFYDLALEQFDFSSFDVVISTTSTIGHCLLTLPKTLSLCYYHNLNRHLYISPSPLLKFYQKIDSIYSHRPDFTFCNSKTVYNRLKQKLNLHPKIIHPGIDVDFFKPAKKSIDDYFLVVSRLVPHKNIDIVIKAFENLPYNLQIIGTGRQSALLQKLAKDNPRIKFLGLISQQKLLDAYQNCRALICPQIEDFGLTPIEAQACGKPVIALGIGGNTETIVNSKTGIFFDNPTTPALIKAINIFQKTKFSSAVCRQNALRFSENTFMLNFRQTVDLLWLQHLTTIF